MDHPGVHVFKHLTPHYLPYTRNQLAQRSVDTSMMSITTKLHIYTVDHNPDGQEFDSQGDPRQQLTQHWAPLAARVLAGGHVDAHARVSRAAPFRIAA